MSGSKSDHETTRPPNEGGWVRFGSGLSEAESPTETGQRSYPALWNPIPPFVPIRHELQRPSGILESPGWRGEPGGGAAIVPRTRSRLPDTVVDYPQVLRGPTRAWWRPILALLLLGALYGVFIVGLFPVGALYAAVAGVDDIVLWLDEQLAGDGAPDAGGFLLLNLSLVILIPAAMLSVWAVHRIRPRFLSSVAGGLRWRWLLRCVIVLAPLWVVYLTLSAITDPPQSPRPDQWIALMLVVLITTPWQAAAEEYLFRGWLTQNIGVYFARPLLAFLVPTVVAAALFAAAHGSPDPWILADLAVFSIVASVMTWRTGGLEAAIVMHAVNNVGIELIVIAIGGFDEVLIGAGTKGTPLTFAVSLLIQLLALALVLWQARRAGIDRWFRPGAARTALPSTPARTVTKELT